MIFSLFTAPQTVSNMHAQVTPSGKGTNNNNSNNSNRIERHNSRFLVSSLHRKLSPTCTLKWPERTRVQVTHNTASAFHMAACHASHGAKGQLSCCFFLFFFCCFFFCAFPSYFSGVHHFGVRFLRMWPFFNPTIKVVTFRLRGWCVLGVFLLPAFTRLGHERQDLLSPWDEMHVCTD